MSRTSTPQNKNPLSLLALLAVGASLQTLAWFNSSTCMAEGAELTAAVQPSVDSNTSQWFKKALGDLQNNIDTKPQQWPSAQQIMSET